jgi:hypothetical protein
MKNLTMKEAETIYCHLIKTNQEFCFYEGILTSREECKEVIQNGSLIEALLK